jgi:predicted Zn-dependent protease
MYSRSLRAATALLLAISLWASAVSVIAAPPQQPQQDQKKTEQKKDAKDSKDQKSAATGQKSTAATAPAQNSGKPLSTNEDPNMIGKRKINKGIIASMSGSTEKEVALGRQIAAEVDREAKFIDDPVITEYVNRVGQNIVLHSDAKVPFTIKVIDSDEINAFALPGGFFYVNKGLILAADNEAELAGVMAHEIAHVAARHAVENQTKASLIQYGLIAGSIFLGGWPGVIFNNTAGLGLLLTFMKFSRGAEEEADKLGVQYLYASGYDPSSMATMFEKLEAQNKKKPGLISKAFASHPQPPDRRASALALAARFPEREEYVISTSEFQRVKSRLLRLSNARATTAGDISDSGNGTPGRPTLKRRSPSADDNQTGEPGSTTAPPSGQKPASPPKLKRNDGSAAPPPPSDTAPASQPATTTTP